MSCTIDHIAAEELRDLVGAYVKRREWRDLWRNLPVRDDRMDLTKKELSFRPEEQAKSEQEFLALLSIARDRGWHITDHGWLRDQEGCCPICAVVNEIDPTSPYTTAARFALTRVELHVPEFVVRSIVGAADMRGYRRDMRAKMCAVLGVTQ